MKKRTKAETERFYREILAEQRESGLSVRAFGKAQGIPAGTLSFWRHQLRKRDAARRGKRKPKPGFVPVRVVEGRAASPVPRAEPTNATPPSGGGGYEVDLGGGRVLRLPADFDDGRVAALVRAVASC